jgi:hypothetical protein
MTHILASGVRPHRGASPRRRLTCAGPTESVSIIFRLRHAELWTMLSRDTG